MPTNGRRDLIRRLKVKSKLQNENISFREQIIHVLNNIFVLKSLKFVIKSFNVLAAEVGSRN